jgi:multidrug transporter EmrE-like cation transporter
MAIKYAWILVFWGLHVTAHLCLKFGSTTDTRWWPFFVIGNAFGITATLTLMKVYTAMNPNVALGLCVGGGFLIAQTTIFLAFRSNLSWLQILGIMAITVGMVLLVARPNGDEPSTEPDLKRRAERAPFQTG